MVFEEIGAVLSNAFAAAVPSVVLALALIIRVDSEDRCK
jgi:hypothetical protein